MKIYIRDKIIEETRKCEKKFSCLTGERDDLCKVISCFDDDIHFIVCCNDNPCSYKRSIGSRSYCNCPVRIEIYDQLKI